MAVVYVVVTYSFDRGYYLCWPRVAERVQAWPIVVQRDTPRFHISCQSKDENSRQIS